MRPPRPPSHAAPLTPATSAPQRRTIGRSSARKRPARATSSEHGGEPPPPSRSATRRYELREARAALVRRVEQDASGPGRRCYLQQRGRRHRLAGEIGVGDEHHAAPRGRRRRAPRTADSARRCARRRSAMPSNPTLTSEAPSRGEARACASSAAGSQASPSAAVTGRAARNRRHDSRAACRARPGQARRAPGSLASTMSAPPSRAAAASSRSPR